MMGFARAQAILGLIRDRQSTLFILAAGHARLRDQLLQFRNARTAIGAGFQPHADFG